MRFAVWLIERPRWFKRAVLIVNDLVLLSLAVWAAYTLRLSRLYVPDSLEKWLVIAAAPVIGVAVFHMRGLYKLVTRFIGPEGTTRIYIAVLIAAAPLNLGSLEAVQDWGKEPGARPIPARRSSLPAESFEAGNLAALEEDSESMMRAAEYARNGSHA